MTALPAAPTTSWHRHGWLVLLVAGVALFLAVERTYVATQSPNLVPTAILLAALLGGALGTVVACTLEFDLQRDLGVLPTVGVGVIEEATKLLAVVLLFPRTRHRADGLLLGVAAGAGFAAAATGWTARAVARFVAAFVVAVALHTAWDSSRSLVWTAAVAVLSLALLGWTVHRVAIGRRHTPVAMILQPGSTRR